jgi:AcrR family transcriptional regulator
MNDGSSDPAQNVEKIIDAAMTLAATVGWDKCTLLDIAAEAEVEVSELARDLGGKTGILRALAARIDTTALSNMNLGDEPDIPIRERLLEMLMQRFDTMAPYKAGIASVIRSVPANPCLALEGAPALARSMRETLASAGISTRGAFGLIRVKALTLIFLDVLRVWVDDENPDLSTTIRRLDERLSQAETLALAFGIAKSEAPV